MDEEGRSRDRAGRRAKRFLTPLQKYEIYLQEAQTNPDPSMSALCETPRRSGLACRA